MTGRRNWTLFPRGDGPGRRRAGWIAAALTLALIGAGAAAAWAPWQALLGGEELADAPRLDPQAEAERDAAFRARTAARTPEEVPVFARSAFLSLVAEIGDSFREGRTVEGVAALRRAVDKWPNMLGLRIGLADVLAREGRPSDAEAQLMAAAKAGYRDAERIEASPAYAKMRGRPLFQAALEAMRAPPPDPAPPPAPAIPTPVADGEALLTPANAEWSRSDGVVRALFALPPPDGSPPVAMSGDRPEAQALNRLVAAGLAAGSRGDFYENRDDGHSLLRRGLFPQLTYLEHSPQVRAQGFGRGVAEGIALSVDGEPYPPLFGNSSTAIAGGPYWRSMGRLGLTSSGGPRELWREYASNQIYIYPEHKDHDGFYGDVFSANTPYMIVSQGSSGSDRTAMRCVAMILAALPPETKQALIDRRMIAPTVQMIWRRGQEGIESDADYLSARAHPTVFDPDLAEPLRMIERANALTPEAIPPLVTLQAVAESRPTPGIELFGDGLTQVGFDTPSAISRLFRGTGRTLSLSVAAAARKGPQGAAVPARFRWRLLRGDPAGVRIVPDGPDGASARIEVDWRQQVEAPERGLRSHRVDIAVFAETEGAALSAPAFVSIAFPPQQERIYDDDTGRAAMINYDAGVLQAEYSDPWLWPQRSWRDVYSYDAEGGPAGWTRSAEDAFERYTRHGARVVETDARERPLRAEIMRYPLAPGEDSRKVMRAPTGHELRYAYDGPDDRIGAATPIPAPSVTDPAN